MIMPYYAVPKGMTAEEIGMAYNKEIITGLLRDKLGYTGVVNSDTGITTGMPWGVESVEPQGPLPESDRGGRRPPGRRRDAGAHGRAGQGRRPRPRRASTSRRAASCRCYFALGLFENPYANPDEAARDRAEAPTSSRRPTWRSASRSSC